MFFVLYLGIILPYRTMKNVLTVSILISVLTFCGRNQAVDESLDRAESCMSASPDSALAILESIDSIHFDSRSQNARYALLKSIALDKNYIDRTDDSLVNIAVSYYRHRRNAPYKFKSYYYQARIYQNAGLMDKAMESLVCAEHINSNKIDDENRARLYFLKAQLFSSQFDMDYANESLSKAAELYKSAGKRNNYITAILCRANNLIIQDRDDEFNECMSIVSKEDSLSIRNEISYNELKILYSLRNDIGRDSLYVLVEHYRQCVNDSLNSPGTLLAQVYFRLGKYDSAIDALVNHRNFHDVSSDESYYLLLSNTYAKKKDYYSAYMNLIEYSTISDSLDMAKIKYEIKSICEKYDEKINAQKQKTILILAIIVIALCFVWAVFVIHKRRKEIITLKSKYDDLSNEYISLQKIKEEYSVYKNCCDTIDEITEILNCRIKALGSFLSKDIPDSLSKVADKLDALVKDKTSVTESIGMLYAIYHPNFVLRLEGFGLTASEIGYCCLLLLGFKTSELSAIVDKSNTYNISSRLRLKIKLDSSVPRLSIWLKQLYAESEAEMGK